MLQPKPKPKPKTETCRCWLEVNTASHNVSLNLSCS